MAADLETWCQEKVEELLLQREHLLELKREDEEKSVACSLPHFKTFLDMYRAIEKEELLLLEINDRIQTVKREKEITAMKKAISTLQLRDSSQGNEISFVQRWLREMLAYREKRKEEGNIVEDSLGGLKIYYNSLADLINQDFTAEIFYDIAFEDATEERPKEKLSWSSRYKGRCTRITVASEPMCRSSDPDDYSFSASFYVNRLVRKGKEYISGGKTAEDFVKDIVWTGIQELIDIQPDLR